ncbi:putative pentatricopeptide repeat-containing protein [Sesamum angolense]|uniref:Pentatricopeptide repeat-containing protein n=1 Tax=Sesamum angolense TaxID=2727404 RepID=A0AAE1WZG0_9LAMI|nr:putative pentatricopeptide repeat-containing protein [Sesamum angolense]
MPCNGDSFITVRYSTSDAQPTPNNIPWTTEKPKREFSYRRHREKILPWQESKESQSCYLQVSVNQGVERSRRLRGGSESVSETSQLKSYSEVLRNCAAEMCLNKDAVENVVSWTALISGFVAQGYGVESVELFYEMRREDVRANEFTFATVLKGCSMLLDLEFGKQLHGELVKVGCLSDVYVGAALIDLYSKCGEMEYAVDVFRVMPEKNAVMWNALLNGYAQVGHGEAVLQLFSKMTEPEMRFSNYTLSIVLKGIGSSGAFRAGQAVHSIVIKIGGEPDDFVTCSLVNMYSKCGVANDALKVFEMIKSPDIVAWSSIISVLDQQGLKEEAAKFFHLMRRTGMRPNQFTLSSLVSAATDLGDLRYGQSIHACAHKFGFESDDLVSNALIGMYMKFQSTYDGYHIFNKMTNRDVVSWNALLSGFHDETSDQGSGSLGRCL